MKITNELRSRITREVQAKYEPELKAIEEKYHAESETLIKVITTELNDMVTKYPNLKPLLVGRGTNEDRVRSSIYGLKPKTMVDAQFNERCAVQDKITNEIENIIITISYGKTIEDVKEAFKAYNLNF